MFEHRTTAPKPSVTRRGALRSGVLAAAGLAGLAACDAPSSATLASAAITPSVDPSAKSHTATRLLVSPGIPFEEMVSRYEATVPPLPAAQMIADLRTKPFAEVKKFLADASPVSMFIFWTLNVTPFMTAAGHAGKCKTYLMGNPLIAEAMYGYSPEVMLYAPLRTVIFTDPAGVSHLAMDRPGDLFGSFDEAHIAATGHTLDQKLVALLKHLQFPVPPELSA